MELKPEVDDMSDNIRVCPDKSRAISLVHPDAPITMVLESAQCPPDCPGPQEVDRDASSIIGKWPLVLVFGDTKDICMRNR